MGETLSTEVTTAVAAREGVDASQLDERLYDAVDGDALARVVESADVDRLEVRFTYCGYDVVVDGTGDVSVVQSGPRPKPSDRAGRQSAAGDS